MVELLYLPRNLPIDSDYDDIQDTSELTDPMLSQTSRPCESALYGTEISCPDIQPTSTVYTTTTRKVSYSASHTYLLPLSGLGPSANANSPNTIKISASTTNPGFASTIAANGSLPQNTSTIVFSSTSSTTSDRTTLTTSPVSKVLMSNPNATCPCFNSTIDKPADCGVGAMVGGLIGVGASAGFALFAITAALLFRRAIRKSKVSGAVQERRIADTNIPNRTQHDSTNLEKGCDIGFGNNPVEGGLVDVDLHSPGKEFVATKRGMGKGGNRASVVSSVSSMRDYDSYDYCEGPSERNVDRWGSRRR